MAWQALKAKARDQLFKGDIGLAAHTLVEAMCVAVLPVAWVPLWQLAQLPLTPE